MFRKLTRCPLGVIAAVVLGGCGSSEGLPTGTAASPQDHTHDQGLGHAHPTEGPHGGHLVELGEGAYHAELVEDESAGAVSVHLLDAEGGGPVAIADPEINLQLFHDGQFVTFAFEAVPDATGAEGATSHFQSADMELWEVWHHEEQLRGRLQVTINGKPYTGLIEHDVHDHHHEDEHPDHDHSETEHYDAQQHLD